MAIFTAHVAADTVGSAAQLPFPTNVALPSTIVIQFQFAPNYYLNIELNAVADDNGNVVGVQTHDFSTNSLLYTWQSDGVFYSTATYTEILIGSAKTPGLQGTSQELNEFLFQYHDTFYGSDAGDRFCGWEGNDWFKLGGGNDDCYFARGQDKDTFKNFNAKKDTAILDTDLVSKLKDAKKIKFKGEKKTVLKFDEGDQVVFKGKKVPHNLKQLKNCVDIEDWYA